MPLCSAHLARTYTAVLAAWDVMRRPPAALTPGLLPGGAVSGVIHGLGMGSKRPLVEQTEGQDKRKTQGGGREMKQKR